MMTIDSSLNIVILKAPRELAHFTCYAELISYDFMWRLIVLEGLKIDINLIEI